MGQAAQATSLGGKECYLLQHPTGGDKSIPVTHIQAKPSRSSNRKTSKEKPSAISKDFWFPIVDDILAIAVGSSADVFSRR